MENRERFKAEVRFEHILHVMCLDEKLRDSLAAALEWIELDFRTTFAHEHSRIYGALGYANHRNFHDSQRHDKVLGKISDEIDKSKERCIPHLIQKYGDIPVWAMVEVVSFGNIVHMYRNMHIHDQPHIAKRYTVKSDILGSYIQHISVVRNMCAHHARLWDKTFYGFRPLYDWRKVNLFVADTQHLFHTFLLAYRLTQHIPAACFDRIAWKNRLVTLLKEFQMLPNCNPFEIMGIPTNGFDNAWWV